MKLYSENNNYKLYHGNMLDMLQVIAPNSIDSIVTDPPYELNFMGKGWDNSGIAFKAETWKNCYEVLKPGGYLLAFGGSRTFHRIACAIEDAGFEIRDTIMWIYGSGFPKSMNIGLALDKKNGVDSPVIGVKEHCKKDFKDGNLYAQAEANKNNTKCFGYGTQKIKEAQNKWKGWGTALKPAFEPIIVARKPFDSSLVDNIVEYGVGGLNIDECRVPAKPGEYDIRHYQGEDCFQNLKPKESQYQVKPQPDGRFPANVILTYDETDYDEVCGGFPISDRPNGSITNPNLRNSLGNNGIYGKYSDNQPLWDAYKDKGSASRYFYCSKASKKDRNEGLDDFEDKFKPAAEYRPFLMKEALDGKTEHNAYLRLGKVKNNHPTVKPTDLMQYLVRLVTPNGGVVLDPFNGSGSTGKAVMYENVERDKNYSYIGIELTEEYLPIAKARIEYASRQEKCVDSVEKVEEKCEKTVAEQVSLW